MYISIFPCRWGCAGNGGRRFWVSSCVAASLVSDDLTREVRGLLPAGHNAAVDGENDAGNETRLIGGEEKQRLGCTHRLAVTAERVHRLEGRQPSFHLLGREERAVHWRLDHRGCDRVHANLVGRQLDREVLDQRMESGVRR